MREHGIIAPHGWGLSNINDNGGCNCHVGFFNVRLLLLFAAPQWGSRVFSVVLAALCGLVATRMSRMCVVVEGDTVRVIDMWRTYVLDRSDLQENTSREVSENCGSPTATNASASEQIESTTASAANVRTDNTSLSATASSVERGTTSCRVAAAMAPTTPGVDSAQNLQLATAGFS